MSESTKTMFFTPLGLFFCLSFGLKEEIYGDFLAKRRVRWYSPEDDELRHEINEITLEEPYEKLEEFSDLVTIIELALNKLCSGLGKVNVTMSFDGMYDASTAYQGTIEERGIAVNFLFAHLGYLLEIPDEHANEFTPSVLAGE